MSERIDLRSTSDGVILPVQARAAARKNGITGVHAGRLKISVTQAREKGKANQALIKLLAERLEIKRSQITLLAGATSNHKQFLIAGADLFALEEQLAALSPADA